MAERLEAQQSGCDEPDGGYSDIRTPGYVCLIQKVDSTGAPLENYYRIVVIGENEQLRLTNKEQLVVKKRVSSMHKAEREVCKVLKCKPDSWFKNTEIEDIEDTFSETINNLERQGN